MFLWIVWRLLLIGSSQIYDGTMKIQTASTLCIRNLEILHILIFYYNLKRNPKEIQLFQTAFVVEGLT